MKQAFLFAIIRNLNIGLQMFAERSSVAFLSVVFGQVLRAGVPCWLKGLTILPIMLNHSCHNG